METDLTSIIIGMASLATFFVPIGYYQHHEKKIQKQSKQQFLKIAGDIGFQLGEFEILRNRAVIGIGKNGEQLLYVSGKEHQLIELAEVVDCTIYKKNGKSEAEGDARMQQIGLRLQIQKRESVRLPVFEGKEGTVIGDERLITQRWISKISRAQNALSSVIHN